jgi:transcriptional regulator with XRE-family HTH domain
MSKKENVQARFGREIRRRREARSLTLEGLAVRSGMTANFIGTLENGRRDPSLTTIFALAEGLGVEVGELFGMRPEFSPGATEAASLFDRLAEELQESVAATLRALVKPMKD